jgi:hypothetical protein
VLARLLLGTSFKSEHRDADQDESADLLMAS